MNTILDDIRAHYGMSELAHRIASALGSGAAKEGRYNVKELAPMDQFHTRGLAATVDLAQLADVGAGAKVLDIGCGLGGPARFLAATYGCEVNGIDLSKEFIEAARELTAGCGLSAVVDCQFGDALDISFPPETFDFVFLQHVAMNIADRDALYAGIRRVLRPKGRLALHDIVLRTGNPHFPVPWARSPTTSFLLNEQDTRAALTRAGFSELEWRDDTTAAREFFAALSNTPPKGPTLGVVLGPDFPSMLRNLGRNIGEGRLGVLMAVLEGAALQKQID
jgi:sarcosine/dimethylglycine N-methyltransferase